MRPQPACIWTHIWATPKWCSYWLRAALTAALQDVRIFSITNLVFFCLSTTENKLCKAWRLICYARKNYRAFCGIWLRRFMGKPSVREGTRWRLRDGVWDCEILRSKGFFLIILNRITFLIPPPTSQLHIAIFISVWGSFSGQPYRS